MVARAPAEASAAGSVTCRHSGSCKENRRKRADGLRIKSHTGKIHADTGGLWAGAPAAGGTAVFAGAPIWAGAPLSWEFQPIRWQ